MRKAYEQPKLFAESFELLEHISACTGYAAGLDLTTARSADAGCAYKYEGFMLFVAGLKDCTDDGGDYDGAELDWNVICYNNPDGHPGHPFGS